MKLVLCPKCGDVFSLQQSNENRTCLCTSSWGRYINDEKAIVGGAAIPFGIGNGSFNMALYRGQFTFEGFFYEPYGWCDPENVKHEDEKVAAAWHIRFIDNAPLQTVVNEKL